MQVNVVSVSVVMNADRAKGYYISLFSEIASRSVSFAEVRTVRWKGHCALALVDPDLDSHGFTDGAHL